MRLVGTTKSTIAGIRDRTHWNAQALQPLDPVTLGLCSQIDLDLEVQRAAKEKPAIEDRGATLLPAAVTTAAAEAKAEAEQSAKKPGDELNVDAVFAKLKQLGKQRRQGRVMFAANSLSSCKLLSFPRSGRAAGRIDYCPATGTV